MPDAPGLELLLAEINREHPGAVLDTSFDREQAALIIDPAKNVEVLAWLRDTEGQGYTFLSSVHGVDYLPNQPRFAVHYELLNRERYERLRVKAVLVDPATRSRDEAAAGSADDIAEAVVSPEHEDYGPGADASVSERLSTEAARSAAEETDPELTDLPHLRSVVDLFPTAEFQEREIYDFFGIVFDGHPDLRRILMPEDYVGWPQRRDFPVGGEPVLFTKDEPDSPGWWK